MGAVWDQGKCGDKSLMGGDGRHVSHLSEEWHRMGAVWDQGKCGDKSLMGGDGRHVCHLREGTMAICQMR